jgi:hypothetical protein
MYQNKQVSTDWRLPNATRNKIVRDANIRCHALGCDTQANRWSNLCGKCEVRYLRYNMPIFGEATAEQMAEAKALLRATFRPAIESGLFDRWVKHIASRMFRPEGLAIAPLKIGDKRNPTDRLDHLLAWRGKGRCSGGVMVQSRTLGRTAVINLLALALCVDAFITPTIVQPLRRDYVFPLLGGRLLRPR